MTLTVSSNPKLFFISAAKPYLPPLCSYTYFLGQSDHVGNGRKTISRHAPGFMPSTRGTKREAERVRGDEGSSLLAAQRAPSPTPPGHGL